MPNTQLRSFQMLVVAAAALACASAQAEGPMINDDAGTLDVGKMKLEAAVSKEGSYRDLALGFGFSPMQTLEVGLGLMQARDSGVNGKGSGINFKWVPWINGPWSAGLKLDWSQFTVLSNTERATTLSGLVTFRPEKGLIWHANVGTTKLSGVSQKSNFLGVGMEYPLRDNMQLTGDVSRDFDAKDTLWQLGWRMALADGLKVFAAVSKLSGASDTGITAGVAWEF